MRSEFVHTVSHDLRSREISEWSKALRGIPGQKNIILFTMGFGNDVVRRNNPDNPIFEMMAKAHPQRDGTSVGQSPSYAVPEAGSTIQ